MSGLLALLVPIIVFVVVALVLVALLERFSPDATLTYVGKIVIFAVVVIALIQKLLPLLHL